MNIKRNVEDLIGNTPLVRLDRLAAKLNLTGTIYAKLEGFNATGSVKDRIALNMILGAEKDGILKPGSTIIEATSGNTGIGLAAIGAARGYKVILVMPESMSVERRKLLKVYGATLVLTAKELGMKGSIAKALELKNTIADSVILNQFENHYNPLMHYETTGKEIWDSLGKEFDLFIAGSGTGGTISGAGRYLKEKNPDLKIINVKPATMPHKIQGIAPGFIPSNLDLKIIDETVEVTDSEAYSMVLQLARSEGLFVGISAGAALAATAKVLGERKAVVVLPDLGDRYLSNLDLE